jgi:hypothetical protein
MQKPFKKQLIYFVLAFVLPILAVLWWWGLFSTSQVTQQLSSSYRYVYLQAQGPYSKLADKQAEVRFLLKQQAITPGAEFTLVLSDPRTTPYSDLKARTGYLIGAQDQPKAPLLVGDVPAGSALVAEIKAHPLFAYGKNYAALLAYAKQHQIAFSLPTIEIMQHSVLRVEMPLASAPLSTALREERP